MILSAVNLGDSEHLHVAIEYTITKDNGISNKSLNILTVHRAPVGDFQAKIASIHAQGFSVRVFEIQPAGETSLSFVWEHPGGNRNESTFTNSEFIINYNYDFDSWVVGDKVTITLRLDTPASLGSCSSEPVTKSVAIPGGVRGFNMLTISNNAVINRTLLKRDGTFNLSDFNPNNQYSFEALTVPETVGSVVFTYTNPANNVRVLPAVNATPYHMPNGWQPVVGVHKIKAQAFREVNSRQMEGIAATVILRINDSEINTDTPTAPQTTTLLNHLPLILPKTGKEITPAKVVDQKLNIADSFRWEFRPQLKQKLGVDEGVLNPLIEDKSLVTSYNRASNNYVKLNQVLATSAITLLFILGWSYSSSKQPRNQTNSAPPSKPITSTELMN